MPASKDLSLEEREQRVYTRLGTYPALSKGQFLSFLFGNSAQIEVTLKSLVKQGLVRSRVVRSGRDIVELFYRADRAQYVEPFLDVLNEQ